MVEMDRLMEALARIELEGTRRVMVPALTIAQALGEDDGRRIWGRLQRAASMDLVKCRRMGGVHGIFWGTTLHGRDWMRKRGLTVDPGHHK